MTIAGYWGLPTSTVDWCEANYAVSPYVAEWFNTLSSLAMVVAGGLGLRWARSRRVDVRVRAAFALLMLVGVGSVAFHATLRFELQMLDELPMLYLILMLTHLLVADDLPARWRPRLAPLLLGYAVLTTYLCAFTRGPSQFWFFQLSFGSLELLCVVRACLLWREAKAGRRRFLRGMAAYAVAVEAWFLDVRFCGRFWNPQLHAVWHVLVSYGFLELLRAVESARAAATARA